MSWRVGPVGGLRALLALSEDLVRPPAPTAEHTVICNPRSRESDALSWSLWALHVGYITFSQNTETYKLKIKKSLKNDSMHKLKDIG